MTRSTEPARDHTAVRAGLLFALATATISGVSVALNAVAVREFGDPVVFTTLKNAVAAVILLALAAVVVPRAGTTLRSLRTGAAVGLLAIGLVGGGIPFILFFTGLANASAPAAAVIHKTMFVWVAILAAVVLRERLGLLQVAAMGVLLAATLLVQPPSGVRWTGGEAMIAAATGLWAIEVVVARRVLRDVPAPIGAAARMSIGLVILVGFLVVSGRIGAMAALTVSQWTWVGLTGLLLAGYVGTWYAALRRAPAAAVTAILTVGAPITAAIQLVASGQLPAVPALAGYAGVLAAAAVIGLGLLSPEPLRLGGRVSPAEGR